MLEFIDIVLTQNGTFCVAPPWVIKEGDYVCLPNFITGKDELQEVISVTTDRTDGDHINMMEKYAGGVLPRITAKYEKTEVFWDVTDNDR